MKKALLAALTFIVVGFLLVNSTFALSNLDEVFTDLTDVLGEVLGLPQPGGEIVNVALVSDNTPQQLYPGGTASRTTRVKNQGTGDVYYRLCYAVQDNSWDKLNIAFAAPGYDETDWLPITIGTTPYRMKVFTYPQELPAGAESAPVTLTITMASSMTSAELANYRSDFIQTQVLAIDVETFKDYSAEATLDLALPITNNFNPF